ncbi:hypothetical protein [Sphingomonas endolithica]|uniref:hypothetical protein n=1 Tax=Sphingomonas endolithica TaxID=2972485 RepID=UPI0021AEF8A1|nr:hypothetical protein [Sphingomonas sp. ZFBP2030]
MTPTSIKQGQDAAPILARIGLKAPPSAIVEYVRQERGMDDNARLILLMPAGEWAAMQATPPLDAVAPDRYTANEATLLGASEGAWHPSDEPAIKGAQFNLPAATYLNVGVAPANEGRVRVYLSWFET